MFPTRRVLAGAALLLVSGAGPASAQASLYLPLDDARLALLEHLIARGDVADPAPFIRPFRLADAVRVLAAADTAPDSPAGRLVRQLRAEFTEDTASARWGVDVRAGGQAYTQKRPTLFTWAGRARPIGTSTSRSAACWVPSPSRPARPPSPGSSEIPTGPTRRRSTSPDGWWRATSAGRSVLGR